MWFLIYLLVQIEQISAFLAKGEVLLWLSLASTVMILLGSLISERKLWEEFPKIVRTIKVAVTVGVLGLFLSYAMPTQRNLGIIIASSATYSALTSDTAQRVGNKALSALEKKLDEIMGEDGVQEAKKARDSKESSGGSKPASEQAASPEGQDKVHSKGE